VIHRHLSFTEIRFLLLLSTGLWSESSYKPSSQSAEMCHCWLTTSYCPNNRVTYVHVLLSAQCITWLPVLSQLVPGLTPEVVCVRFVVDWVKSGRFILRGIGFYPANHHCTNAPYLSIIRGRYNGFDSRQCKIFLFSTKSRSTLGPTQPPIQKVPGALSPRVKWQRREAEHSTPFSVEVKKSGGIPPLPPMASWHNAQLIKHKDIFTFTRDRYNRSIWVQRTKEASLTPLLNCLMRLDVLHWLVANETRIL
jgi:hypothetical protein